jgi:hypothetical protein
MNYTHKHGVSMHRAFEQLYDDGGIARFYAGAGPALLQVRTPSMHTSMHIRIQDRTCSHLVVCVFMCVLGSFEPFW